MTSMTIDCRDAEIHATPTMQAVIDWLRLSPVASTPVHVTVPSILSGLSARKYQTQLQALGCRVTCRMR